MDPAVGDHEWRRRRDRAARRRAPAPSALNSRVPSVSPSACPASTTRTSSPGMRARRSASAARAASVCFARVAEILARALVDDDDGDGGQRLAVLAGERRIGEREHEQRQRQRRAAARRGCAPSSQQTPRRQARCRRPTQTHERRERAARMRYRSSCDELLLSQPFEQRRHVHLIGLVVAGQRVHHDVDAGAEGQSRAGAARPAPSAASAGRRAASPRRRRDRSR